MGETESGATVEAGRPVGFKTQAPAKLILTGEHAVVYGKLALAASVDLLTTVSVTFPPLSSVLSVRLEDFNSFTWSLPLTELPDCESRPPDLDEALLDRLKALIPPEGQTAEPVRLSLLAVCYIHCSLIRPAQRRGVDLVISSAIPIGAGLGSSAAFSVAVTAACYRLTQDFSTASDPSPLNSSELERINSWAFQCERMFHATPSGIDNAVATYGGVVKFQNKLVVDTLPALPEVRILLVDTGVSRQTRRMVEAVRVWRDRFPAVVNSILDSIDHISHQMTDIIHRQPSAENYPDIQELLSANHYLLCALGVSHGMLDQIHSLARSHNLAGKMTGAGGGGLFFIWLDPSSVDGKVDALKCDLAGLLPGISACRLARLGVQGLRIEAL